MKSSRFKYCVIAGFIVVCAAISFAIIWPEYWMDWDMQRYVVQVKQHEVGDGSFSYPHNLLKSWLYNATRFVQPITKTFEPIEGARFLTVLSAVSASVLVAFTTLAVTGQIWVCLFAGFLWFCLPGNIEMMRILEDNSWANAFNAAYLFATTKAAQIGFRYRMPSLRITAAWSLMAGAVLAVGINIHQQLAILFWGFFVLMGLAFDFYRDDWKKECIRWFCASVIFVASYFIFSILQNRFVFGDYHAFESMHRLVHNPYSGIYPHLWFFTAEQTFAQWSERVLLGWRGLLLLDAERMVAIHYVFLVFVGLLFWGLHKIRALRGTLFLLPEIRTLLWFVAAFGIHIPYSLLYEPENIERWDSVLPGMVVAAVCLVAFCFRYASEILPKLIWVRRKQYYLLYSGYLLLAFAMFVSFLQIADHCISENDAYAKSSAVEELHAVRDYLERSDNTTAAHVVLVSGALVHSDLQVRLTYYFPDATVYTLNKDLRCVYSSLPLQLRGDTPDVFVEELPILDAVNVSAVASVYEIMKERVPDLTESGILEVIPHE